MRKKNWLINIIPAAIALTISSANGASLVKMSFDEIIKDAELIVVAHPINQKMTTNSTAGVLETEYEISETITGNKYSTIKVHKLGMMPIQEGQKTATIIPGSTQYSNTKETMLFLTKKGNSNTWVIVGSSQGVMDMSEDTNGVMVINGIGKNMTMSDVKNRISTIQQSNN